MIDEIYVNGDSFSALDLGQDGLKVYSQHLQELTGITTINHAVPGSSNDRIIRTTMDHCIQSHRLDKKLLVVLNLSYFSREELWWPDHDNRLPRPRAYSYHDSVQPSWFVTMDALLDGDQVPETIKNTVIFADEARQLMHTLTNVYMLTLALRSWGFDYVIFSAPGQQHFKNFRLATRDHSTGTDYLDQSTIWQALCADPNILNLEQWNLVSWASNMQHRKKDNHLTPKGHEYFAQFLMSRTALAIT